MNVIICSCLIFEESFGADASSVLFHSRIECSRNRLPSNYLLSFIDYSAGTMAVLPSQRNAIRLFRAIYRPREAGRWRDGKRTFLEIEIELIVLKRRRGRCVRLTNRPSLRRSPSTTCTTLSRPPFFVSLLLLTGSAHFFSEFP